MADHPPMPTTHERAQWRVLSTIEKFHGDDKTPYEVHTEEDNLLLYIGVSTIWERLIGTSVTAFNNANAYLGVGNSSTAEVATQTDLQGASKFYKVMDATYPLHTPGSTSAAASITFKVTIATTFAEFAWNEWCLTNSSTGSGAGQVLNRKVLTGAGTKVPGDQWTLTVTLTLA